MAENVNYREVRSNRMKLLPVNLSVFFIVFSLVFPPAILLADDKAIVDSGGEQQKLVRVSTLNSIEANQEFQRNVQVIQAQKQRVIQLQSALENSDDANLKKELDLAWDKLRDSNKKMTEAYGFSLARDYVLVVEKAHIYMAVSEEELAKINKRRNNGGQ